MSLAERRRLRLFTLCALYVAQGIPWGFTALTIPAYLAGQGLPPAYVGGALAMTTLPYAFKWIWGPIIDAFTIRRLGRRRPWIIFAQAGMALTIGAMISIPDLSGDLEMLALLIFVHTVFNSMQDVAVDGLAVDLLRDDERGRANGMMYASKYGGGILGGAGMATVIAHAGLRTALIAQVVILLAIMLVPLLVRESDQPPPKPPKLVTVLRSLAQVFQLRSPALGGLLMLTIGIATGMLTAVSAVLFTQELGWKYDEYAQITGGPGLVLGLAGSLIGGFLADKVGPRRLAAIASLTMAALWIAWAATEPLWTDRSYVYLLFLVEPVCQGVMTVSLFALCMAMSWPRIAATQFTTYMAFSNVASTIGFRIAGPISENLDFQAIYLVAGCMQIVATLTLLFIDPHQARRTLGDGLH
ncbi:MAG: MFS transporter [Deltaproteobacteria bacterium]|nr:MFS transporter [Deltaproteobacteria bacterium]